MTNFPSDLCRPRMSWNTKMYPSAVSAECPPEASPPL